METLLVELRTEELPPKSLARLSEAFARSITERLRRLDYLGSGSTMCAFATPRRLAVLITQVRGVAPDRPIVDKLMPAKVALDASGVASPALVKKLTALGRPDLATAPLSRTHGPDAVYVEFDGKADYMYMRSLAKGLALARGLQEALEEAIVALPIAKAMRYPGRGAYYNDQTFVRPAHGLVALHGADEVDVQALGLRAGRMTAGHRFLARGDIEIRTAEAYEATLEAEGKLVPSFAKRRAAIVAALARAAEGAAVIQPDELLDEVTALVEQPAVYAGTFDRAFLEVPQECLILTMQRNQRYFALADASGALRHRFLLVSNLPTDDPSAIVAGNERVLRARLADARFFYDQDRRAPLGSRLDRLSSIIHHNKLGTLAERVDRLRMLAKRIAPLIGADVTLADRAAQLAKADLVTDMVGEFPELQGTMGRYYARHDGEAPEVCAAIEQHYWPKAAGGELPESTVAQAVALADKLETLAGMFGIGQLPTGDKDPMGLRRAALGLIRILVERKHALSLGSLVDFAFDAFEGVPAVKRDPAALLDFIYERLRGYLREQGYTALEVAAVVDTRPGSIDDLPARLSAVRSFGALPEAESLASANKRIVNILRKSGGEAASSVDRALLNPGAEHDLYSAVQTLLPAVREHMQRGDYTAALKALASARAPVDRFFDDVMVMADDRALRANRLALLRGLAEAMNQVADISKLAA